MTGVTGDQFLEGIARRTEPHEDPDHLVTGLTEECRGDGGIDAAAHGDQDFARLGRKHVTIVEETAGSSPTSSKNAWAADSAQ